MTTLIIDIFLGISWASSYREPQFNFFVYPFFWHLFVIVRIINEHLIPSAVLASISLSCFTLWRRRSWGAQGRAQQAQLELRCAGPKPRSHVGWGCSSPTLAESFRPPHPVKRSLWPYRSARSNTRSRLAMGRCPIAYRHVISVEENSTEYRGVIT
ncbi:hypothetical protein V8F33_000905 [Rhypophila sp. PSN 637]